MNRIFPASMDELHEMLELVRRELQVAAFEGAIQTQVELALEEAIVNIIKHGYKNSSGNINIECIHLMDKRGIKVILTDTGIPYNPLLNAPKIDPTVSMDARPIGGYGVFLIRKIMDEVEYLHLEGGNILTLIKFLAR